MIELDLHCSVQTHAAPSPYVIEVASMFGIGLDEQRTIELIPPTRLTLAPGRVVFITGASGGGKSTLLRLIREGIGRSVSHDRPTAIDFDTINPPDDCAIVDGFSQANPPDDAATPPLKEVLRWLSLSGINDAFVMLRRPGELSDGQRYRLKLAHAMALAQVSTAAWPVILADEFGASLDRVTAQAVSRGVRKWATRSGTCVVAATTHDDLLEALDPDVLIHQQPGSAMTMVARQTKDHP